MTTEKIDIHKRVLGFLEQETIIAVVVFHLLRPHLPFPGEAALRRFHPPGRYNRG